MIFYKKAPAGFIAQFFSDGPIPTDAAPGTLLLKQDHVFLDVTGHWSPTLEEAIDTVKKQRPKEIKKLQKKIEALEAKLAIARAWMRVVEGASEEVVKEKV